MKSAVRFALAPAVLMLLIGTQARAAQIRWEPSLSSALAHAKQKQQVVMVDFYTDWCTWCKKLDKDTYTDAAVVSASRELVAVKVNAEKEGTAAARKYNVRGYPTIVFLNGNGEVEGQIGGYMPGAQFAAEMNKIVARSRQRPVMEARIRRNPRDLDAIGMLAPVYANRGQIERARKLIAQGEKVDPGNKRGRLSAGYNALGDYHQGRGEFQLAIPLFKKAAVTGADPQDAAYGYISIAACYLTKRDAKGAVPYLQSALKVRGIPADLRSQAEAMLQFAKHQK